MATDLRAQPTDVERGHDDSFQHTVCCIDGNSRTFCGLDGSVLPWTENDPPCVVCDHLERTTGLCPAGGWCVNEEPED